MAIDSRIPLSGTLADLPGAFAQGQQLVQQQRAQQQEQAIRAQQMEAGGLEIEQRRGQMDTAKREAFEDQRLRQLLSRSTPPTPTEIYSIVGVTRGNDVLKGFAALQGEQLKTADEVRTYTGTMAGAILALPEPMRAEAWTTARENALSRGLTPADVPEQYPGPEGLTQLQRWAMSPKEQVDATQPKLTSVAPGSSLIDERNLDAGAVYTAPPKAAEPPAVGTFEDYVTEKYGPRPSPVQIASARREYGEAGRAPTINISTAQEPIEAPADPESQDIMAHAGLSYNGFLAATGRMSLLARDQVTRNRASAEVAAWARSRGMDVSTLASQYKAYNETLEANIQRFNRTVLAEGEIAADIENLLESVKTSGLGEVKALNATKQWLKGEFNDPNAAEYAFYLNQLTNDIALYNAASQGRATLQSDMEEAKSVVQRGVATGSLNGLQKAITQSVEKMGVVLEASVNRSRKNVWDLFGVGDKYKPTTRKKDDPMGIR